MAPPITPCVTAPGRIRRRIAYALPVLCGLVLAGPLLAAGPDGGAPAALENVTRISADRTEAVRAALLKNKAVLDAGQRAEPGSPAWVRAEQAAAEVWVAGGEQAPTILKALLKEGGARGVSAEQGALLWKIRQGWLYEGIKQAALKGDARFAVLDSGTEGSIANDIDKTLRRLRGSAPGGLSDEALIALVRKEVESVVQQRTGKPITLGALDIELFSGRNFYPRWWEGTSAASFKREVFRVYDELRRNPAAYVTDGAQKMQVIKRVEDKDAKLRRTGGTGAAVQMIVPDAKTGQVAVEPAGEDWMDALGLSGQLEAHDAAGASLGNLLMLQHKLSAEHGPLTARQVDAVKDDVAKYFTRDLLDTATVIDTRANKPPAGGRYEPGDFTTLEQRRALLSRLTGIAPTDSRLAGYQLAMEVSQELLENKRLRAAGKPVKPDRLVFDKLAAYLADTPAEYAADPQGWQDKARLAYAKLAKDGAMAVLGNHFNAVAQNWLEPDPKLIARGQRHDPNFKNQNVRILAMALLKQAHDMSEAEGGKGPWQQLQAKVDPKYAQDLENFDRMLSLFRPRAPAAPPSGEAAAAAEQQAQGKAAEASKGVLASLMKRFPLTTEQGRLFSVSDEDIWRWSLNKAFAHLPPVEREQRIQKWLQALDVDDGHLLDPRRVVNLRRVMHTLASFGQPSTLLGFAQVWQQTEGQPQAARRKAVQDAMLDHLVGQLPVYGAARGLYHAVEARDAQGLLTQVVPLLEEKLAGGGPAGPIILYVEFSKKFVGVIGHEIFHPLRQDYIDLVYKGYMEPSEAGLLRAGRNVPQGFQPSAAQSLLAYVPVRFALLEGDTLDRLMTQLDRDAAGRDAFIAIADQMQAAVGQPAQVWVDLDSPYEQWIPELQRELYDLQRPAGDPEVRQYLDDRAAALNQVLTQWKKEAAVARAVREAIRQDPRLAFEVRRQNLYARFRDRMQAVFGAREGRAATTDEIYADFDRDDARLRQALWGLRAPTLAQAEAQRQALEDAQAVLKRRLDEHRQAVHDAFTEVALAYVEEWCLARGDFAADDVNLAVRWVWHDEETKRGIAARLVDDYQASEQLTAAAEAHRQVLRQLKTAALQRVDQMRLRRLAIATENAWATPNAADARTWALALGEPPDTPASLKLDVAVVESRDSTGKPRQDLVVEAKASAVPARVGDNWNLAVPQVSKIAAANLPATVLKGLKPSQVEQAFKLDVALIAGEGDDPTYWQTVATATHYLFTRKGGAPAPVAETSTARVPPLRLVGIEGDQPDPGNRSGRKRLDTPGFSGDLMLTLTVPDTIVPGQPFEMKSAMIVAGRLKGGAAPVQAAVARSELVPIDVQADGRVTGRVEQTEASRYTDFGDKGYEWNYVYQGVPRSGKPREYWLRYLIHSDAPSFEGINRTGAGQSPTGTVSAFKSTRNEFTFEGRLRVGEREERIVLRAIYDASGTPLAAAGVAPTTVGSGEAGGGPGGGAGAGAGIGGGSSGGLATAAGGGGQGGSATGGSLAGGGGGSGGAPAGGSRLPPPLDGTAPWNDDRVQDWMNDWLDHATPPSPSPDIRMHYNRWAQPLSQAATSTGSPTLPPGWNRQRYLWERRDKLTSTNLCTMGEYLLRRAGNRGTADCLRAPAPGKKPPTPPAADDRLLDDDLFGGGPGPAGGFQTDLSVHPTTASATPPPATVKPPVASPAKPSGLPGLLGILDAAPADQWINGKPALRSRTVIVHLYDEAIPDNGVIGKRGTFKCFGDVRRRQAILDQQGIPFVTVFVDQTASRQPARPIWENTVRRRAYTFPLLADSGRQVIPALADAARGAGMLTIGPDGRVLRRDSLCEGPLIDLVTGVRVEDPPEKK